jgi:hypothetical protein
MKSLWILFKAWLLILVPIGLRSYKKYLSLKLFLKIIYLKIFKMINESLKNRLKELAGILNEDTIKLSSSTGRSGEETLSFYSEDYLLNLGSKILTSLDNEIQEEEGLTLQMSQSSTKINANSLFIKLNVVGNYQEIKLNEEFEITLTVQFSDNSNTIVAIDYKGLINKFNLNSKHSTEDLDKFESEIVQNILNSIKIF